MPKLMSNAGYYRLTPAFRYDSKELKRRQVLTLDKGLAGRLLRLLFPVEDVSSQIATDGDLGVVEISLVIPHKAEALHQADRPKVGGGAKRDDLGEASLGETIVDRLAGGLVGDATPPKLFAQAPEYLGAGGKRQRVGGHVQPHRSGKDAIDLHRPDAPATLGDFISEVVKGRQGFTPRHRQQVTHDLRVGVHLREPLKVRVLQGA